MEDRKGFTLVELLVVIAVIALLAGILFPVFARTRESARQAACLSNLKQIGAAIVLYAQDYDEEFPTGGYPYPRNWEVNPTWDPYGRVWPQARGDCFPNTLRGPLPGLPGPPLSGCVFGFEFYRLLMHVQLGPYLQSFLVWYCPSDTRARPYPSYVQVGLQSYHWFPNWVYNSAGYTAFCPAPPFLDDEPPAAHGIEKPAERMLMSERGVYGYQGPDAWAGRLASDDFNHPAGYNVLYFDGHAKLMPYGHKRDTLPRTHWPPCQ